ncbi:MAG: hypothetical protein ACRDST_22695 [Pseudonocardiaceae bacterium]
MSVPLTAIARRALCAPARSSSGLVCPEESPWRPGGDSCWAGTDFLDLDVGLA